MPVDIEPRTTPGPRPRSAAGMRIGRGIVIGLINNMPDAALHSTEAQFRSLLQAAAGGQSIELRLSSFPELPRARDGLEHVARCYWPPDALLREPAEALIVPGTDPRPRRLHQAGAQSVAFFSRPSRVRGHNAAEGVPARCRPILTGRAAVLSDAPAWLFLAHSNGNAPGVRGAGTRQPHHRASGQLSI